MAEIYNEYLTMDFDDKGCPKNLKFNIKDNFNFAYDVVDELAKRSPDKRALIYQDVKGNVKEFSFSDISRMSNKAANILSQNGVKKGDRVMLMMKRRYQYWFITIALHKLGAITIPTSHMVTEKDVADRVECAGINTIIGVADPYVLDTLNKTKPLVGDKVKMYTADKAVSGFDYFFENVDSVSDKFDRVENSIKDIMLLYFTSGTSGKPKGVEHDFSYPLAHIVTAKFWHGCKDGGVHFAIADSGWAKSAWGKLYGQWFCECAVVVYDFENFIGHETLALLENFKVTSFCAPPTIYKYLVREKLEDYDLSNLEELVTAGEKMPEAIAQNFEKRTGKHIREGFGQTETVLQLASYTWCPDIKDGLGVASPIYNIDVVDELGNPVPNGEEGELVIRPWIDGQIPIGIFTAYFNDAELYKYVWRQGMYHTNDKVVRDINGVFHYIARADDVIKSSGYRIGPAEVEEVLMNEPSVLECAVTGYPSKNRGQVVKATIVLKPELKYTDIKNVEKEIKKFVQDRVAAYKMPRMIEFVESLPKSTSGKISRELIRRMDLKKLNSI